MKKQATPAAPEGVEIHVGGTALSLPVHERTLLRVLHNLAKGSESPEVAVPAAFEALQIISGFYSGHGTVKPPDYLHTALIPVPRWVIDSLGMGWFRYCHAPAGTTFGESLGVEGHGQGRRPAKEKWKLMLRDFRLARMVSDNRNKTRQAGQPAKLTDIFDSVAEEAKCTPYTVSQAWKSYGRTVRETAKTWS
jgi:hypothetical protein